MKLGNFSTSLVVKDIKISIKFYQNIGFDIFHDQSQQGWAIMKNQSCVIGLFQGMFEKNILTFNPGWDADGQAVPDYTDIRDIQKELKSKGIKIAEEVDENTSGPASFVVEDPDGNPIMFDQHV
ncbi:MULTISPECIES: VOC family protein [unclassified Lentilitoribacter]|jgi:catechol 2,3-dioxygenase-like lactoylglutathione lyase family enzyme|uniref:VOC family protein n=1 Tax=unclassified Lentilitoribacter TaxID=2647570 RepID=UPI0013A6A30C|nr:VOC family protein [Lentilitoribacter sp. Alg239-R112]